MSDKSRKQPGGAGAQDLRVPEQVANAYRALGSEQPPALLDQAVRNRAHAAVANSGAHKDRAGSLRPWSFGWLHALSTAAIVVLATTVLLQLREESPVGLRGTDEAERSEAAPEQRSAPSPAPASSPLPETNGLRSTPAATLSVPQGDRTAPSRTLDEGLQEAAKERAEVPAERSRAAISALAGAPAEAQLQAVIELLESGEDEAARSALEQFREQWPDHPLPEALQKLLQDAKP